MKRILFSCTVWPPFIEEDFRILSRHFLVEKLLAHGPEALVRIPGGVLRSHLTLSWFGSVYAGYTVFLAKLLGRRSVVIVGGVDASRDREINYGIWLSPWKSLFVRYAYRHADRVLVVDPFLGREVVRLAEYDGANVENVPTGYDGAQWTPGGRKEVLVATVASCENMWRFRKKGLDKLFEAARMLPDLPFVVIGMHRTLLQELQALVPPNVEIVAHMPRADILPFLRRAKVYAQPSYTEGLPNALCEAMLCECVPVGTVAGGIPTAIGDAGHLVPYGDVPALARALRMASAAPESAGVKARERILREFPLQKREQTLVRILTELMH